jgi:hypothetical protein
VFSCDFDNIHQYLLFPRQSISLSQHTDRHTHTHSMSSSPSPSHSQVKGQRPCHAPQSQYDHDGSLRQEEGGERGDGTSVVVGSKQHGEHETESVACSNGLHLGVGDEEGVVREEW